MAFGRPFAVAIKVIFWTKNHPRTTPDLPPNEGISQNLSGDKRPLLCDSALNWLGHIVQPVRGFSELIFIRESYRTGSLREWASAKWWAHQLGSCTSTNIQMGNKSKKTQKKELIIWAIRARKLFYCLYYLYFLSPPSFCGMLLCIEKMQESLMMNYSIWQ